MIFRCQICGKPCDDKRWLAYGEVTFRFCDRHTAHEILAWFSETILCQKFPKTQDLIS